MGNEYGRVDGQGTRLSLMKSNRCSHFAVSQETG